MNTERYEVRKGIVEGDMWPTKYSVYDTHAQRPLCSCYRKCDAARIARMLNAADDLLMEDR